MLPTRIERPVILGIVGDSASGKTTMSRGIAEILGPDRVTVICVDDYHRHDRVERRSNGISPIDLRGNYVEIIEQHIQLLRQGKPILKPVYNHDKGTLDRPVLVEPSEYIIAEGLLGYSTRAMRDCYDVKVFLDPEEELRLLWKIQRDTTQRGYTRAEVLQQIESRKHDSPTFIQPQRTFSDIVIRVHRGGRQDWDPRRLDVRHILRPTLPHPDFTPLLEDGTGRGIRFELTRDIDGKPVDALDILGDIPDARARHLEDLVWALLPEARGLRDLGRFDDESGELTSHPLALTQLLVAFHMVKAAHGVHAI